MKKLTKGQRFALAREARRLAMECVEGTAPTIGRFTRGHRNDFGRYVPNCALGWVEHRANGRVFKHGFNFTTAFPETERSLVVQANDDRVAGEAERKSFLVFPLLALADALEASAASARQRPQKQSTVVP